ncbi:MAG: malto-oligosyltrehalose trehalohydrolase, partial [Deltaproteobacteria bacterium]|nr:malto-oligosyltrehalose trehalohydrolase [Kofleriaceae bacterium]
MTRRRPIGAELIAGEGVHFRVWAPKRRRVSVVLDDGTEIVLAPEASGYFAGAAAAAAAGTRYRFRLDGGELLVPDPASRFQPDGPHGPSEVIDPRAFAWTDGAWRGAPDAHVVYELHVGTFTREGTFAAAARELPALAELGVTTVELMPVADFAGTRGWGYDGVDLFAPTRLYGRPDDLRAFVDAAHGVGLAVILDVVYNHFGPDGNYLGQLADYTTKRHAGDWGDPLDMEAAPVREYLTTNAATWIDEYHLDGLRLDATHGIFDDGPEHIVAAVVRAARAAAGDRRVWIVAEHERQDPRLLHEMDVDAVWNDDFHHAAYGALTGRHEAYMRGFRGAAQELLAVVRHGFLYQGARHAWQLETRATPIFDVAPARSVVYLDNHDQVANRRADGARIDKLASPGSYRAMTALLLLGPMTPLLFQGQEHGASSPFLYFVDHAGELGGLVTEGRAAFMRQFPSVIAYEREQALPDPGALATFERARLDLGERAREPHRRVWHLHADLLALRRALPRRADGALLGP